MWLALLWEETGPLSNPWTPRIWGCPMFLPLVFAEQWGSWVWEARSFPEALVKVIP
jgi:hypothetical protein